MPGKKFHPRKRCLRCGRRGRITVEISDHVHRKSFCSIGCLRAYQEANPERTIKRL